jgi:hypothetical protein
MKGKVWFDALVAAIAAFLSTAALADCRLDPREVHFASDSAARLKSYACTLQGTGSAGGINVEFYDFTVQSASMIASGHPPSAVSPILGSFNTIKTKTLDQFKSLVDRYGISLSFDDGASASVDVGAKNSSSANNEVGKFNTVRIDYEFEYPAIEQVQLEKHVIPDRMSIFYAKSDGFKESSPHAIFWRYATLQDIADLPANARAKKSNINPDGFFWMDGASTSPTSYNKYLGLLRYLSGGEELPEGFLILYGFFGSNPQFDNCGDIWLFEIVSPRLALETMLIRNTSSQDIRVESILGEETGDMRLRRLESSVTASASGSAISVGAVIRRGEALLVPYRIALRSNFKLLSEQAPRQAAEVYQQLVAKGITARPDVYATPSTPSFAFGSELRIAGMVISGNPIQLSARSSNFVDVSFGDGTGSCPYLLSWDEQRRDWVEHGKVLHPANEQRLESSQSINLSGLVTRFRLEEREAEVTTLDRADLFLTLKDGEQVAARPADPGGRGATPSLVFWGEAREFAFALPPGVSADEVTDSRLVLTGYYRRYSSFPNVSRGGGAVYLQATVTSEWTPSH